MLWAIEPILILALAGSFLHEPVTARLVELSAVALVGIALVLYDPSGSGQWLGVALTIAGVACCATYTVIARRWLGTADSTVLVVAVQQSYALVLALGLVCGVTIAAGAFRLPAVSLLGWLSAITSGVLYYAGAYWFYLTGLREARASIAAAAFYLIPVFGVTGGVVFLGDRLDSRQWLGVVIVVAAVIAIAVQQSRPARVRT